MEMARVDASVSLFFLVHDSLCMSTIGALGSDEQKQRFLPRLAAFEHVGCWALTEPEVGDTNQRRRKTCLEGVSSEPNNRTVVSACSCSGQRVLHF
jgi:alkylation response protein AidB-like acyl-CoA dehydrogenase